MSKAPAFQFYTGDWVQDTRCLSLAAKGAWIDLLSAMWHSQTKGELSFPMVGYARIIGASVEQTELAIKELTDMNICDSEINGNGNITLKNRRMYREHKERESTRYRVQRFRNEHNKRVCNADVTPPSSSSSLSSNKNITQLFEEFWKLYPSRNGRKLTKKESLQFFKDNFKEQSQIDLLLKATLNYSKGAKEGFVRDPVRFLKKDFWKDWIEPENEGDPYSHIPTIGGRNEFKD